MVYMVGVLICVSTWALVIALLAESPAAQAGTRIRRLRDEVRLVVRGTRLDAQMSRHIGSRLVAPKLTAFLSAVLNLAPTRVIATTRASLEQAGRSSSRDLATFLTFRIVLLAVAVFAAFALPAILPGPKWIALTGGLCLVLVGGTLPDNLLNSKIRARQNAIRRSLPDILDLLVVSTEAGTGLDGAMRVVVERKRGPLPDEFGRFLSEVQFGRSRAQAWQDVAKRAGIGDLSTLIRAIQQADKMGVSIANTLRTQAAGLRAKHSQMIRHEAATMPIKMLFPLVFCIFPALFVVVMAPGMIAIHDLFNKI